MDSLFVRYANPFLFMDGMIQTGRFHYFVRSFVLERNKERSEKVLWEYYIHRVFDCAFDEFKQRIEDDKKNRQMSAFDMETTINESMDILKSFKPTEGGER